MWTLIPPTSSALSSTSPQWIPVLPLNSSSWVSCENKAQDMTNNSAGQTKNEQLLAETDNYHPWGGP